MALTEDNLPDVTFDDSPFEPARLTIDLYHRMIDLDVFSSDDHLELLEGVIVARGPKSPPHVLTSTLLDRTVTPFVPSAWHSIRYAPMTLADSEPEPDFTVIRGALEDYRDRHPRGADVGLVAEVADVTLEKDRRKRRVYARAAIPFYWLINLKARLIECYSEPAILNGIPGYKSLHLFDEEDEIPLILNGRECGRFAVQTVLPQIRDEVDFDPRRT